MNRKSFLQAITAAAGAMIITPLMLLKKEEKELIIDGIDQKLDLSKFDVYYDFTKPEYGIYNHKRQIVGWKDISGNGRDAHTPIAFGIDEINVKKIAISNKCENLVEYL